jgi:peptide/nickel transport system ATP-binding protein
MTAVLEVRGLRTELQDRRRRRIRRGGRRQFLGGGRPHAGHRRRIGLRQERDLAVHHGPGAQSAGRVSAGSIRFEGRDLATLAPDAMRDLRGNRMAMIFQEPMTSLNPAFTIGDQIVEGMLRHRASARRRPGRAPSTCCARCASLARAAHRRIPAQAFGRHAPARDDRHGAGLRAAAADRRRTDHRAGRHHPGADPGPDAHAARGTGTAIILITHDLGVVAEWPTTSP